MADSSTGGYLPAIGSQPQEDAALDQIFQQLVKNITGLDGSLVRPRWQEIAPNIPDMGADWAAVGVTERSADTNHFEHHATNEAYPDGVSSIARQEELTVLCSFYGRNAGKNAAITRDGIGLGQNREAIETAGIGFVSVSDLQNVPTEINGRFFYRVDLRIIFRRTALRSYSVLNITTQNYTIIRS